MTIPVIAAATGAIIIILQALLMVMAGAYRAKSGINMGTGDDPVMERKIRRHGNLAENAGLFIAVLALAEMTVVPDNIVQIIAIVFVVARISHAIALSSVAGSHGGTSGNGGKFFVVARVIGAFGTLASFLALGGFLLNGLIR
ncbi:MAPEG family protein [Parasphingorhabdus halotolerans]|uniref:MAPEG family protein n=1 Tax=Parasphingorhabdus halotolerans TaxID=2725558 RepID=A0A6H2DLK9_9SPHN|nr:MAPEG family protein [Parasphingorhabdus halotolerans]QJB69549.1 MAPEG family protein [Parasphingorhabdus halotolerans]